MFFERLVRKIYLPVNSNVDNREFVLEIRIIESLVCILIFLSIYLIIFITGIGLIKFLTVGSVALTTI